MSAQRLDGKALAASLNETLAREVGVWTAQSGVVPHLAAVLVGDDPASAVYVRNKQRGCTQVGLRSTLHRLTAEATQAELLELVDQLNREGDVHGILVQLPLPKQIDETAVLDAVRPEKDVDCFHPENVGRLAQGRARFAPCTPSGCMKLIEHAGFSLPGSRAVVIGRSDIVGKPMALLLMQKGADATVTVAHSRTRELATLTREADLLIAAIGRPNFVTAEMVRPGACVIDVGINRVGDKLVGDVDFAGVEPIAGAITPVPGGVGPMTIAMLLRNTFTAAQLQTSEF